MTNTTTPPISTDSWDYKFRLEYLHNKVTEAITEAERLKREGCAMDSARCFEKILSLEQEIVEWAPAATIESEASRLSAVYAALSSGNPGMAFFLAERYSEDASEHLKPRLARLKQQAEKVALQAIGIVNNYFEDDQPKEQ